MSNYPVLDSYSQLRRAISGVSAAEMRALDFGPKQMILYFRLSQSSATMGELAEYSLSDKAAATRAVASLEKSGMVRRVARENDRRVTVIELTAKGKLKAAKAVKLRNSIAERVADCLTEAEQKQVAALMSKIADGLQAEKQQNLKSKSQRK